MWHIGLRCWGLWLLLVHLSLPLYPFHIFRPALSNHPPLLSLPTHPPQN